MGCFHRIRVFRFERSDLCDAGVWGIAILSLSAIAFGEDNKDCCRPKKGAARQSESRPADDSKPRSFPVMCPMWTLLNLGGGNYLYHTLYYETSCEDEPIVFEMEGSYALSPGCPTNCPDAKRKDGDAAPGPLFEGLDDYVALDYVHLLPAGDDREFSKVFVDPLLPYISFQPDPRLSTLRYAKVFAYVLDFQNRYNRPELKNQIMYLAMEVKGPLPAGTLAPFACCERLEHFDHREKCHVFRATYRGNNPPTQMLLLTPKEAP